MPETLMAVDDHALLKQAEILALRSMQDAIKGIREDTGSIRDQVQEVRERMIRIEAQDTTVKMANFETRISVLEDDKIRLQGAAGVLGFLGKNWQFLALLGFAVYTLWTHGVAVLPHP